MIYDSGNADNVYMRKRVFIGFWVLIAATVIGLTVFFVSQPRKGTVEYHQRAYDRAAERLRMSDWRSRLGHRTSYPMALTLRLYPSIEERGRLLDEMRSHTADLVRLKALAPQREAGGRETGK